MKGYRKLIALFISLVFAIILPLFVPESALIPAYSFAGTAISGFFAANWAVNKENIKNGK